MNHADMQHLNIEFPYRKQYGNFIGGEWVAPVGGEYFDNVSPVTGRPFTAILARAKPTSSSRSTPLTRPRRAGPRRARPSARTCC